MAVQYTRIENNADKKDEDLYQARISHTYSYEELVFKSFAYHIESLVEPYIYVSFPTQGSLDVQKLNALSEEIKYHHDKHELTVLLTYSVIENFLRVSPSGTSYINSSDDVSNASGYIEHTYHFDLENKLISNLSYSYIKENSKHETGAFMRMLNTQGDFDIFNEIIYNHNDVNHHHYVDYSAGVRYHYNDTLTLSIKGENLFDKAYEDTYSRFDPATSTPEEPIMISPVEQRVYMSMEYLF